VIVSVAMNDLPH